MSTGSGSGFALTRLASKYAEAKNDGALLSNRAALDVIDHRLQVLLERTENGEAPERMAAIIRLWNEYKNEGDEKKKLAAYIALDNAVEAATTDYLAWTQIFEAINLRSTVTDREAKIWKELKGLMSVEQAYEFAAKLQAAVMRVCADEPEKLKQIQYEFTRIIGESSDSAR